MVGSPKVRILCASISFLFARLGASLEVSRTFRLLVEGYVFRDSSLSVVLADLYPLLYQSVDWFEELVDKQRVMLEVRSSDLDMGLSSSDDPVEVEEDTMVAGPREVKAFSTHGEECGLDVETFSRFRDRFQFPKRVRIHCPHKGEQAYHFSLGEVCFYKAAFPCGLRSPIYPFIIELLSHFNIAPRQLMPNSWRIVISYMEIWLATTEGDMIRVDEFTYLYRLKEFKEYGYYELVPWVKKARIVTDLPSSFRYWKSQFFFLLGDDWETPSDEA